MKAVVKTEVGFDHMEYMDVPEPEVSFPGTGEGRHRREKPASLSGGLYSL